MSSRHRQKTDAAIANMKLVRQKTTAQPLSDIDLLLIHEGPVP
jgi:hypothetical protein